MAPSDGNWKPSDDAGQPVDVGAISSDDVRSATGSNAGEFHLLNPEANKIWIQTTDGPVNSVVVSLDGALTEADTVSGSVCIVNNQGVVIKQRFPTQKRL